MRALIGRACLRAITSDILSKLLGWPGFGPGELLRWCIASGDIGERRLVDTAWRKNTVCARAFGTYHPVGTCRMGRESDPRAVTGPTVGSWASSN